MTTTLGRPLVPQKQSLPPADEFGSYYLGPNRRIGIFPSKRLVEGKVIRNGGFIVSISGEFLWDDGKLEVFRTPDDALCHLKTI